MNRPVSSVVLVGVLGLALTLGAPCALAAQAAADTIPPVDWSDLDRGPSLTARIASGVGGALLGAGLGYFASQVQKGDWEEAAGGRTVNRSLWAAIGGTVGFTVGLRFPVGGRGHPGGRSFPTGRDHIGIGALEGRGFDTAYEVVRMLRPEWLQVRGNRSLAAGIDPVVAEGTGTATTISGTTPLIDEAATIQVYVNDVRIGGIDALNTVDAIVIHDIYHFDAARATARWGGSNPHGAILIIT